MALVLVQRSGDFLVHIKGKTYIWECGITIEAALLRWRMSHPKYAHLILEIN